MNPLTLALRKELNACLLCHDAPCSRACPEVSPERLFRACRFENFVGASSLLSQVDGGVRCPTTCTEVCPLGLPVSQMVASLRECLPPPPSRELLSGVDLSCDICGVRMENPFLLSSSVVSSTYEMCAAAFESGWAGAAFKTICLMEMHEASPRFSAMKGPNGTFVGFKNIEELSEKPLEEDLEIFRRLKRDYPDKVLIASIMGRDESEWEYLARVSSEAGADIIECNFSCPNMMVGGVGSDVGQSSEAVSLYTAAARKGTARPLLVKLTPNVADMRPMARAAALQRADGFALINTIKSFTHVNLDSFVPDPDVRGRSCSGGYSGSAVKPIALRFIADLAGDEPLAGLHLSGMGGIQTWRDAVEYLLLGAGSVQITTAVMEYGIRIIDDLLSGLRGYMAEKGFRHVSELIGLASPKVVAASSLERDTVVYPRFDHDRCVGCGRCYLSCRDGGHQAIRFDGVRRRPGLDGRKCVGCHLCYLVCPTGAISLAGKSVPRRVSKGE